MPLIDEWNLHYFTHFCFVYFRKKSIQLLSILCKKITNVKSSNCKIVIKTRTAPKNTHFEDDWKLRINRKLHIIYCMYARPRLPIAKNYIILYLRLSSIPHGSVWRSMIFCIWALIWSLLESVSKRWLWPSTLLRSSIICLYLFLFYVSLKT